MPAILTPHTIARANAWEQRGTDTCLTADAEQHLTRPYGLVRAFTIGSGPDIVAFDVFHHGFKWSKRTIIIPPSAPAWVEDQISKNLPQLLAS